METCCCKAIFRKTHSLGILHVHGNAFWWLRHVFFERQVVNCYNSGTRYCHWAEISRHKTLTKFLIIFHCKNLVNERSYSLCKRYLYLQFSSPYFLTLEPNTEIYREIFVFGVNAGKYGTEKLQIQKLLTQCLYYYYPKFSGIFYSD